MGEAAVSVEVVQPKPSRFQFVPVPGEFTRGRWKCRDSVGPYAETLEFDKGGSKEKKPNPNKITVTRKLVRSVGKDELPATASNADNAEKEFMKENVVITRKNGVTIVRKSSGSASPVNMEFDHVKQIALEQLGAMVSNREMGSVVPPTPMNTPPSTISQPGVIAGMITESIPFASQSTAGCSNQKAKNFQVQPVVTENQPPVRKFSHDSAKLQRSNSSMMANVDVSQTYSENMGSKPKIFQVQTVPESELSANSTPAQSSADVSVEQPKSKKFQVEVVKNAMETTKIEIVENALESAHKALEIDTRESAGGNVDAGLSRSIMITVSPSPVKRSELDNNNSINNSTMTTTENNMESIREVASSVSSIEACGIPITPSPNAPHSTPYGTPKDTGLPKLPLLNTDEPNSVITVTEASLTPHLMPIDNKIEQAMELVKTHLTYAVREEIDALKSNITELEYQLREYQYECNFYRQNVSQEMIDQAGAFVRQQMQKHPMPTRRAVSVAGMYVDGGAASSNMASNSHSSPHMRNLQTQIQQIKVKFYGMTITVLMVAEKPMLAESIAKLLSDGKATKRKGWNNACSVSEYSGNFLGKNAWIKVTSTCGHVMSLDFPSKFNNWERVDPSELYSAPTNKIEANPKMKMNDYLASEAKNADYLVLWLDCDKEGENICFEVIEAVRSTMFKSKQNYMDYIYRAKFSAITEKDIKAAMRNLGRPDKNISLSVDARQELDLRIGCSFTRFQTKFFQGKYGDLDSNVISYGPCQTPTLGFCVTRHDQIVQFKPESYWVIRSSWVCGDAPPISPEWSRGRIFDVDVAKFFLDRIKRTKIAHVVDVAKKEARKEKPCALNTVELMRVASSSLGLSPATTMHVAEALYTQGYISYPRTETTAYPLSFDLVGTLRTQTSNRKWGEIVLAEGIKKPKGGVDKGDHPPITPMKPSNGQLSGDHARIYDYVAQHFIATLMKPCIYEITTVKIKCGDETFAIQGKSVVESGFTAVMTWMGIDEESTIPVEIMNKGAQMTLKDAELSARETSPPGYLTESELISLMEKHGIGTDASIPVHINTITQRNYVTVESGRRLVPTKLGQCLVRGYWKVDPELVLPTMRAELETQLNLVASGKADYYEVKNHALKMFELKFQYFVKNIPLVDTLFEASFTTLSASGKPFTRCGKCQRYMKLVETRPQRLFCPTCQDTYAVPNAKDGVLRIMGDAKCPLDGFELVYWQGAGGKLARSYPLCPFCYNNPPFENMPEASGCISCPHPSCPNSYNGVGVCGCLQNCGGVMVVDVQSHPKWRLTCNKCASVIALFDGAQKIRVNNDRSCTECGAQFIRAEYKTAGSNPLNGAASFEGCIFCEASSKYPDAINLNHAYLSEEARDRNIHSGRGRGRGKGRGRGGGGRRGRGSTGRGR
ncbi:unnamed protein product [Caenorhabditis bovis]|uniref:DNA topoisomerase 3-beta-1 n=1 Tax=Caenorhabditis bovis TaxID=2654633 RepID=A0A8S1FB41_9PELO|nr:unnamed protein product [Caenorhabditis bovis]